MNKETILTFVADIVSSHVSNNTIESNEIPKLIQETYAALTGLGKQVVAVEDKPEPAVSARGSVRPDFVVCMDCGFKGKMLKRHLSTEHDLTPSQYRERWNLAPDHPLVAPNYAAQRKALAERNGLGRKVSAAPQVQEADEAWPEDGAEQ